MYTSPQFSGNSFTNDQNCDIFLKLSLENTSQNMAAKNFIRTPVISQVVILPLKKKLIRPDCCHFTGVNEIQFHCAVW